MLDLFASMAFNSPYVKVSGKTGKCSISKLAERFSFTGTTAYLGSVVLNWMLFVTTVAPEDGVVSDDPWFGLRYLQMPIVTAVMMAPPMIIPIGIQ